MVPQSLPHGNASRVMGRVVSVREVIASHQQSRQLRVPITLLVFALFLVSCATPTPPVAPTPTVEQPIVTPYYKVPFEGQCDRGKNWVQANVEVLTGEDPPKPVDGVVVGFYLDTESGPLTYYEADTGRNGKVIVDLEICGQLRYTSISTARGQGIFHIPGLPSIVERGGLWALSLAPVLDVTDPPTPDQNPGFVIEGPRNAGESEGRSYVSRHFFTSFVTRFPDGYFITQYPTQSCYYFDTNRDGVAEPMGVANVAVLWRGNAPDQPENFQRNAIVILEGIDGNNETWPVNWYQILRALNPNFDRWDREPNTLNPNWGPQNWPQSGNWGADVWIVDYAWGGADLQACQIPAAKSLLKQVGDTYIRQYGHPIPLTVMGFSMGGVVARGALAQLDAEPGELPGTSALADLGIKGFLSFDSPQQGAEVHLKTSTLLRQIHEGKFFKEKNKRTTDMERGWLRLWNPAANQLVFEKCVRVYDISGQDEFLTDVADCREKTFAWHDDFYSWLQSQGPAGSRGYPTSIPTYAISLGLGREPESLGSYWIGQNTLWEVDWAWWLDVVPSISTRAETPILGTTDSDWRGRRNRKPGSRLEIVTTLQTPPESPEIIPENPPFWDKPVKLCLFGIDVNYNPTFISLISALDGLPETKDLEVGNSTYFGSSFDRVWYPIERPSYGAGMPCDGGSWFHDPMDIIANKDAIGVNDRVGQGHDTAYGYDSPGTDWMTSTITNFVAGATYSLWKYPLLQVPRATTSTVEWSQAGVWVPKLPPPQNIVLAPTDREVTITWVMQNGLDYEVAWESETGESGVLEHVVSGYVHGGLQNGKKYSYRIRTVQPNGNADACDAVFRPCYDLPADRKSDFSPAVSVYPPDNNPPRGTNVALQAFVGGAGEVILIWKIADPRANAIELYSYYSWA